MTEQHELTEAQMQEFIQQAKAELMHLPVEDATSERAVELHNQIGDWTQRIRRLRMQQCHQ